MSKRYYVTLPDALGDALERWAQAMGDKPASLAAFIVQKGIRDAQDRGEIPPVESDEAKELSHRFLSSLASGNRLPNGEMAVLAYLLNVKAELLIALSEQILEERVK
ncbi:MAG: hypothetical protein WBA77_13165 [Microcoleaceae cyanobacterium]